MEFHEHDPIEAEGIFDGLQWSCVLRGAVLDLVLSFALSIPLVLALSGPAAFDEDSAAAQQVMEATMASPEARLWGAALGLFATLAGAFYGARRAGVLHVRHGGWVAMASLVLGLPVYLNPGVQGSDALPLWVEMLGLAAMLPAGMLGGFLAGVKRDERA